MKLHLDEEEVKALEIVMSLYVEMTCEMIQDYATSRSINDLSDRAVMVESQGCFEVIDYIRTGHRKEFYIANRDRIPHYKRTARQK